MDGGAIFRNAHIRSAQSKILEFLYPTCFKTWGFSPKPGPEIISLMKYGVYKINDRND